MFISIFKGLISIICYYIIFLERKLTTFYKRLIMSDSTTEMLKLVAESDDPVKAALTAYALMLDFLKHHEASKEKSFAIPQVIVPKHLPS